MTQTPKILIVEDEDLQREDLRQNIQSLSSSLQVITAKNLREAEHRLSESVTGNILFHLFLLDIHLSEDAKKCEGFQFARLVRSHTVYQMTPLIFLTSNKEQIEFALNNFHCYNYIKKPYNSGDIASQVEHLLLSYKMRQDVFFIQDTKRIAHRLHKDNILYLESSGHTIKIVCSDGTITTRALNLTSMSERLGEDFFRCHKKFIVNKNLIENYDSLCSNIQIANYVIPVGRVYKDELLESIHLI